MISWSHNELVDITQQIIEQLDILPTDDNWDLITDRVLELQMDPHESVQTWVNEYFKVYGR
jgi:hypothetical protein